MLFLFAAIIVKRELRTRRTFVRAALLTIALALATLTLYIPSPFGTHNLSTVDRLTMTKTNDENLHVRFLFWGIGLQMWRAHPLNGVGAYNYEDNYPQARADFSATRLNDPLITLHDEMLVRFVHNQYVQVLVELGIIGLFIFTVFLLAVAFVFRRAWRFGKSHLVVAGAGGGLLAFTISIFTSINGFAWMGGSLLFFFMTAFLTHCAMRNGVPEKADETHETEAARKVLSFRSAFNMPSLTMPYRISLYVIIAGLLLSLMMGLNAGRRMVSSIFTGIAGNQIDVVMADKFYRQAIAFDPNDAATRYQYGILLYTNGFFLDAIPQLEYSTAHGFNESSCYAVLASTQRAAGDLRASERTLATAVNVYPRSVFMRVRHAKALRELGDAKHADMEENIANSFDERAARSWRDLIDFGIKEAERKAQTDASFIAPDNLHPLSCVRAMVFEKALSPTIKR
ncbi:MAG: hypothetical protein NVSMB56_12360 [Pyrinomonadaceae bacterium]